MFFLSCVCYVFVRVSLFVPCGHLLGIWERTDLWCLTVSYHFPIGILGQVWLIFAPLLTFCYFRFQGIQDICEKYWLKDKNNRKHISVPSFTSS